MAGTVIVGTEQVLAALDEIGDTQEYAQAMLRACALVERAAKQNAPKNTGELARSISSRLEMNDDEVVGVVYTPLEYAPYVEYGTGLFAVNGGRSNVPWCYQDDEGNWHSTSGQHPQPFLEPALNENREEVLRILEGSNG